MVLHEWTNPCTYICVHPEGFAVLQFTVAAATKYQLHFQRLSLRGLTAGAFFGWARMVRPACLQTPAQERFLRSLDECLV